MRLFWQVIAAQSFVAAVRCARDLDGRRMAPDVWSRFNYAWRDNRKLAVATIFRDIESLRAEVELERVAI